MNYLKHVAWSGRLCILRVLLLILMVGLSSCARDRSDPDAGAIRPPLAVKRAISPPLAVKRAVRLAAHGNTRVDHYYWLRQSDDSAVHKLIEAENNYTRAMMAHTRKLQAMIAAEIAARLSSASSSVPVDYGSFEYFREFRSGEDRPRYVRRQNKGGKVETVLDVNELSKGKTFYAIGNWSVSPDGERVAFAEDLSGDKMYQIRIQNIASGRFEDVVLQHSSGDLAWAVNSDLYYVVRDVESYVADRVMRYRLGETDGSAKVVYEEADPTFQVSLSSSRSGEYLLVFLESKDTSQILLLGATSNDASGVKLTDAGSVKLTDAGSVKLTDAGSVKLKPFLPREAAHKYRVFEGTDEFYILTNWQAPNNRVMKVARDSTSNQATWVEVVPHRRDVLLEDIEVFEEYLVLNERKDGLGQLRVIELATGFSIQITFSEPAYSVSLYSNPQIRSTTFRYRYSSFTTPDTVFEVDMATGYQTEVKPASNVSNYRKANYKTERISIAARDGTQVPVSLVYKRDFRKDKGNPLYLSAYGAYGHSSDPEFDVRRFPLLDRGFVCGIVHVRGGRELGESWYEDGRLLNKKNTFTDFIDATKALTELGYGDKSKVFASGASAGGLLMGVLANQAPELFKGIIAHVPFVDLLTTMFDESLPLTQAEFAEWGNPKDRVLYDYMLSYSPYDQVRRQRYPNLFVTTGMHDSQVRYFEPLKWVAKLRDMKMGDSLLLLDVDLNTGHNGSVDSFARVKRTALEYAFIFDLLGIKD